MKRTCRHDTAGASSAQRLRPGTADRPTSAHPPGSGLTSREVFQERLRLPEVGRVEAFGEPIVDGEGAFRLVALALRNEQTRQAQGGTQLPRPGCLTARDLERPADDAQPLVKLTELQARAGQEGKEVRHEQVRAGRAVAREPAPDLGDGQ